ncbi:universal stress protein [Nocardioides sp. MAHUQ-72]|uniref:universal stress protein n=1 Tax=unclassified Nocardioides TaxID=2615069 RepID=UPI00361C1F6A
MPEPSNKPGTKPVVVAVGNDPVDSALEYAVAEALREGCGVHVLHAVHVKPTGPEMVLLDFAEIEQIGHATLHAAVEKAEDLLRGRAPLTSAMVRGPVVQTILEATQDARLVVLQRRDLSRMRRTVTRSVSSGVAAHAHVPVISVPAGWSEETDHPGEQPVVTVGVDIPERCAPVVATAAAAARSRGARLHVLHTWWFPSVYDDIIMSRVENDTWADKAREEIRAVLEGLGDAVAGLPVDVEARHAHPADALIDAGRDSSLLVVGRHDPLVPVGSHLGPVARAVLRDATCPVLLANPSHVHRAGHASAPKSTQEPFVTS